MSAGKRPTDIVGHVAAPVPTPSVTALPQAIDPPSFLVGAAAGFFVTLFLVLLLRKRRLVLTFALGALLLGTVGAGYLTFIKEQTGMQSATPQAMLEQAQAAVDALKQQVVKQEATLEEIGK